MAMASRTPGAVQRDVMMRGVQWTCKWPKEPNPGSHWVGGAANSDGVVVAWLDVANGVIYVGPLSLFMRKMCLYLRINTRTTVTTYGIVYYMCLLVCKRYMYRDTTRGSKIICGRNKKSSILQDIRDNYY